MRPISPVVAPFRIAVALAGCASLLPAGPTAQAAAAEAHVPVKNGGFEAGAEDGWGRGHYSNNRPWWWNSKDCLSVAEISSDEHHGGNRALHIMNLSSREPHVYGTTQQPVPIVPGKRYRVTLWAKAPMVASRGATSIVVDRAWRVRPIQLPAGSFDWQQFAGEFTLSEDTAQLRILCEDMAEVWLDDIEIVPLN